MSGWSSDSERHLSSSIRPLPLLLAALYAGWIWILSASTVGTAGGALWSLLGNAFHYPLFGILAVLLAEAVAAARPLRHSRLALVAGLVTAWGVVDELHQARVPGRQAEVLDVVVDALGGAGFLALWSGLRGGAGRTRAVTGFVVVSSVAMLLVAVRVWAAADASGSA